MRSLLPVLVALFLLVSAPAFAQNQPFTLNDCSVASLTGSSQSMLSANGQRQFLLIVNNSTTNTAYVNLAGGTAAANGTGTISLGVNASYLATRPNVPTNKITVIGTSGQPVACFEGR